VVTRRITRILHWGAQKLRGSTLFLKKLTFLVVALSGVHISGIFETPHPSKASFFAVKIHSMDDWGHAAWLYAPPGGDNDDDEFTCVNSYWDERRRLNLNSGCRKELGRWWQISADTVQDLLLFVKKNLRTRWMPMLLRETCKTTQVQSKLQSVTADAKLFWCRELHVRTQSWSGDGSGSESHPLVRFGYHPR